MPTKEELEAAHKKAVKSLEGEKRAAIKKAKGTKGKKAKEAVAAVEADYASKLKALEQKLKEDIAALSSGGGNGTEEAEPQPAAATTEQEEPPQMTEKERKQEKARRKKERQKEKEAERQRQLEEEEANAGPSMRAVELEQIQKTLTPLNLKVAEVEADGHCLYRAIAAQTNRDYTEIRALCADTLAEHEEDFAPFCEYTEAVTSFADYVARVRNSAEWGGHLELRALGQALGRPIQVYSLQNSQAPLLIGEGEAPPIRLSYHLHYYALGEHYNQVVAA